MLESREVCVDSIFNHNAQFLWRHKIDNYVILNTLQNYHFEDDSICVYDFGQKYAKPNLGKLFKTNINWL